MDRVFSECCHPDGRILSISNILATDLLFPRAGVANVLQLGLWCTWMFGARNSSFNHFWGPFVKATFSPKRGWALVVLWCGVIRCLGWCWLICADVKTVLLIVQPVCLFARAEIKVTSSWELGSDFFEDQLLLFSGFLKLIKGLCEQIQSNTSFSVYSKL